MSGRLTRNEIIEAHKMLQKRLKAPSETGGFWEYERDWDDARIAKIVRSDEGDEIRPTAIGKLRLELFGPVRPTGGGVVFAGKFEAVERRLGETEALGRELAKRVDELAVLHKRLCETLALNRVAEVKHLAGAGAGAVRNGVQS